MESTRFYPNQTAAAHLLGYVKKSKRIPPRGEEAFFPYRLTDYIGLVRGGSRL